MIHDKKEFGIGVALLSVFFVALAAIFMPFFEGGKNTLDYMDGLFNSISKHSAYYIPDVATRNILYGIGAVDIRAQAVDAMGMADTASLDKYRFIRNAYLQRRQYLVYDGKPPPEKEED